MHVAVCAEPAEDAALQARAAQLAADLQLTSLHDSADADLLLLVTPDGLALHARRGPDTLTAGKPFRVELTHLDAHTGPGRSLRQPLMRAVGLRKGDPARPTVLDVTAGFGEDAWLLASIGCRVYAVERNPIVAALLRDGVVRAADHDAETAQRLDVQCADGAALLERLGAGETLLIGVPEVVYIDPMFPAERKALERKPLRLLRSLVGEDADAPRLLELARHVTQRRVVVKRPRRAPPLGDLPPTASHRGRSVRYDVYAAGE